MNDLLQTARDAAEAAAQVHLRHFGAVSADEADEKGRADFVSHVDVEAQRAALGLIRERFPEHQVLAEEADPELGLDPRTPLEPGPVWVVDPLDGTANFLHGHPMFCASVGLVVDGKPVVGAVTAPVLGTRWWAARGVGAFRDGSPIRPSRAEDLTRSLIGTGFPFKAMDHLPDFLREFESVLRNTAGVRRCGSAAIDLCHVAQGTLAAFWEIVLSPWDWAGGLAILTEAGGVFARMDGSPADPLVGGSLLAAGTPGQMEELRSLVAPPG